jgi:DNA polymerase-3 subunit beta
MKFRIACDDFAQTLGRLQGFLSRKPLSEVLSNVLLEVDSKGILCLSATDQEISFQGTLPIRDSVEGALSVDGKKLYAMIRQLPEEEVELTSDDQCILHLKSGRSEMSLHGIEAERFPQLPSSEDAQFFAVKGGIISELFERTSFSISTEESRPNLNGVFLQSLGDGILRAVSTDGHRLTVVERKANLEGEEIDAFDGQIVPRKGVVELKKLLEEYPEVRLAFSTHNLIVQTSDFSIWIRLIAERFPPYEAAIPKSNNCIYRFNRKKLNTVLKRCNLVSDDKLHRVSLDFRDGEVMLESKNSSLGKVEEPLDLLEGSSEEELVVAFSLQYVQDVLNVIQGEEVNLCLGQSENSFGIFKEPEYENDIFVVAPLKR